MYRIKLAILVFSLIWLVVFMLVMDRFLAVNEASVFWRISFASLVFSGVALTVAIYFFTKKSVINTISRRVKALNKKQTMAMIDHSAKVESKIAELLAQSSMPIIAAIARLDPSPSNAAQGRTAANEPEPSQEEDAAILERASVEGNGLRSERQER